jgi:hypothetical protein
LALVEDKFAEAVADELKGYKAKIVTLTVADEASKSVAMAVAADVTKTDEGAASKPAAVPAKTDEAIPTTEKSS